MGKAEKRDFMLGFQDWCNKKRYDEGTTAGKCEKGAVCKYCVQCCDPLACADSLDAMAKAKGVKLDYETVTYEQAWCGCIGENRELTISHLLSQVCDNVCGNLGKYLAQYSDPDEAQAAMISECCESCPVDKIFELLELEGAGK